MFVEKTLVRPGSSSHSVLHQGQTEMVEPTSKEQVALECCTGRGEQHVLRRHSGMSGTTWYMYGLRNANVMRTFHTMLVWWLHVRFSTRRQVHPTFSAAFSPWVHPTPRHAALHRATSNATRPCLIRDARACSLPCFCRFSMKGRISGFELSDSG